MTIVERTKVREAVERALKLDETRCVETAFEAAAQALSLPIEAVADVMQDQGEEQAA